MAKHALDASNLRRGSLGSLMRPGRQLSGPSTCLMHAIEQGVSKSKQVDAG